MQKWLWNISNEVKYYYTPPLFTFLYKILTLHTSLCSHMDPKQTPNIKISPKPGFESTTVWFWGIGFLEWNCLSSVSKYGSSHWENCPSFGRPVQTDIILNTNRLINIPMPLPFPIYVLLYTCTSNIIHHSSFTDRQKDIYHFIEIGWQ